MDATFARSTNFDCSLRKTLPIYEVGEFLGTFMEGTGGMGRSDLRLVGESAGSQPAPATVPLKLQDILPLIALAEREKLAWLADFLDDPILVTPDLAEILARFRTIAREKIA